MARNLDGIPEVKISDTEFDQMLDAMQDIPGPRTIDGGKWFDRLSDKEKFEIQFLINREGGEVPLDDAIRKAVEMLVELPVRRKNLI